MDYSLDSKLLTEIEPIYQMGPISPKTDIVWSEMPRLPGYKSSLPSLAFQLHGFNSMVNLAQVRMI